VIGLLWTLGYYFLFGNNWPPLAIVSAFLVLPAVSAYHGLNFTGCTTYTSRSGVKKEMRFGIPAMGVSIVLGVLLLALSRVTGW
jgi:acetyl-CoA decarbonylase/synthase complex subunit gamma